MWNEMVRRGCRECGPETCCRMNCQDCDDAYDLIDALLINIDRLEHLVVGAREEVNSLIPYGQPPRYYMTYEDVCDGTYDDHPALKRYVKCYGEYALMPWGDDKINKRAVSVVSTTGRRRKEVKSILKNLNRIRDAEEAFLFRIPENFQSTPAYENAELAIDSLEQAIDCLKDAY